MKNWKHYGIVCLIAIIVFVMISYDNNDNQQEQPSFREKTINFSFGEKYYSVIIQGTLLEAEWIRI